MTEPEFLQQIFLLKCDIESAPAINAWEALMRQQWSARLGSLLNQRYATVDPVQEKCDEPSTTA